MAYWGKNYRGNKPNKRPRNVCVALQKFVDWNRQGEGKAQTSSRSSVYWHRDDIFYQNWKPVARCLFGEGGMAMVKLYDKGLGLWRNAEFHVIDEAYIFSVHDICVWGPGKGMKMPDEDFVEVMRLQWLSIGMYLTEAATTLSYDRCAEWVKTENNIALATGKKAHNDWQIDGRLSQVKNMASDYRRFSEMFNLAWDDYPEFAFINAQLKVVREKAKVYTGNQPKRDRIQARKDGVKALTDGVVA